MVLKPSLSHQQFVWSTSNPWETTNIDALVPLSTHKLHVSTSGPPRSPGSPVVLFFSGGGAPCAAYVRLQRLLSKHIRVYFHDRAGYGYSEVGPGDQEDSQDQVLESSRNGEEQQPDQSHRAFSGYLSSSAKKTEQSASSAMHGRVPLLTAQQAATELRELLRVIQVGPPYILIGHSYGGICARAFLALFAQDQEQHYPSVSSSSSSMVYPSSTLEDIIAGMVLPEAGSEILYTVTEPRFPPIALDKMTADVDYEAVTHLREQSKLTDEEWTHIFDLIQRTEDKAMKGEDARVSARRLLRLQQYLHQTLGKAPLSVVRADLVKEFRLLFDAAVKMGKGTEQERNECRLFLETTGLLDDEMRMGQLRLSRGPTKYRRELDHGHAFPMTGPEMIVEEVLWVLDRWREGRRRREHWSG